MYSIQLSRIKGLPSQRLACQHEPSQRKNRQPSHFEILQYFMMRFVNTAVLLIILWCITAMPASSLKCVGRLIVDSSCGMESCKSGEQKGIPCCCMGALWQHQCSCGCFPSMIAHSQQQSLKGQFCICRCLQYALTNGAHITLNSYGAMNANSAALSSAVFATQNAGQLFVTAAGIFLPSNSPWVHHACRHDLSALYTLIDSQAPFLPSLLVPSLLISLEVWQSTNKHASLVRL